MARIRTIKPSFFRSDDVTPLSYRARLTWIGLWTYVDDEGRGVDNARFIKGDLWTLEDHVTHEDVEADLAELHRNHRITRYEVDGKRYLEINKWLSHQVISRPTPSKFPEPTEQNMLTPESLMESSVSVQRVHTAGSGSGSGTGNREREAAPSALDLVAVSTFEDFWGVWPRTEGKADALKAWAKAVRTTSADLIVERAHDYANHPHRPAKQFVPHGATWLNGERWNDGPPTAPERDKQTRTEQNLETVRYFQSLEQTGIEA